jgi:hypothetical protein
MNSIMAYVGSAVAGKHGSESPTRRGPVVIVDDDTADAVLAERVIDELQPRFPGKY